MVLGARNFGVVGRGPANLHLGVRRAEGVRVRRGR